MRRRGFRLVGKLDPISRHQVRRLRAPLHTPPERKSRCPHRPEAQIPPTQQRRWRTSRCRRFHRHRWRVRRPPAQVNAPARAPRPMAPPSARMGRVPVRMRGPAHRRRHARPIPRRVRHVWPRCAAAGRRLSHRRHRPRPRAPTPGLHDFRCCGLLDGGRLRRQRVTAIGTLLGLRG